MQTYINYKNVKEIGNNKGWNDATFEAEMRKIGFQYGHAWCSYFVKHIWNNFDIRCRGKTFASISPSVITTYNNFKSYIENTTLGLNGGSLVIWQSKTNQNSGHIGLFIADKGNGNILTLEGNTDTDGSREGDGIYLKKRKFIACGFNFMGFVNCDYNSDFEDWLLDNVDFHNNQWHNKEYAYNHIENKERQV